MPVLPGLPLPADCGALGAYLAQDTRWPGGGEPGHVHADFGDELLGAGGADAGDLIELGDLGRERGDHLLDPPGQRLDLGGQRVHAIDHHAQQVAVMAAEMPVSASCSTLFLPRIDPRARSARA